MPSQWQGNNTKQLPQKCCYHWKKMNDGRVVEWIRLFTAAHPRLQLTTGERKRL